MEKSLGILFQGRKSSKGKSSKDSGKGKTGNISDGAKGNKRKGNRARQTESFSGFNEAPRGKGQPLVVRSADRMALNFKEPSTAAKEATEM